MWWRCTRGTHSFLIEHRRWTGREAERGEFYVVMRSGDADRGFLEYHELVRLDTGALGTLATLVHIVQQDQ